ncbi:Membrane protein insertase YidC 2 [bacterium HR15]|nr:Membrane protein insertase YidC 2 [bacterium HR15]
MAQEPVDQKKLFIQTMLIAMMLWLLLLMGWSYFTRAPVSDKKPEQIVAEIEKLRADKDYVEAIRRCQELVNRFQGTEYGALGLLLEARIYYEDKKDSREAFNALRRLEEFYPHTQVYRTQGRALQEKVEQEIDQHNRQFLSYQIIHQLVSLLGRSDASYVLAILAIAVAVRLLLLPLSNRQFASMRKMAQIAPKLQELQAKYTGEELMRRQMDLYKRYGINPMSGCLYALLPIPFLIWVYNMILLYQVQFKQGHLLWINPELGARFPGLIGSHLAQFDAPLMILYAISMYVSSRLMVTDPSQAPMQKTMALVTTAMLVIFSWQFRFPAAFILYWMLTNILYTLHYKLYMSHPAPALEALEPATRESTNNLVQDGRKPRYQPPKKRSKRK